jgi:hypothetical protein
VVVVVVVAGLVQGAEVEGGVEEEAEAGEVVVEEEVEEAREAVAISQQILLELV